MITFHTRSGSIYEVDDRARRVRLLVSGRETPPGDAARPGGWHACDGCGERWRDVYDGRVPAVCRGGTFAAPGALPDTFGPSMMDEAVRAAEAGIRRHL